MFIYRHIRRCNRSTHLCLIAFGCTYEKLRGEMGNLRGLSRKGCLLPLHPLDDDGQRAYRQGRTYETTTPFASVSTPGFGMVKN
jgi:hypothetical protein